MMPILRDRVQLLQLSATIYARMCFLGRKQHMPAYALKEDNPPLILSLSIPLSICFLS